MDQVRFKKLKNKRFRTFCFCSQHFVSPEHSLDDFVRSKIYIIDHNPSWKENQRHKRESFCKVTSVSIQALATLVITWFILANRRFREQLGQRFTFLNFFPMMTDNA
jgi:hypothetical protein